MLENVLITGGTGLIGRKLSVLLQKHGYTVSCLSRNTRGQIQGIRYYKWDISTKYIDRQAIEKANYIIHLAGAGITDKRWTASYKKEILESRTLTTALLFKYLKNNEHSHLKAFISASAVGIYGSSGKQLMQEEQTTSDNSFLKKVCIEWEKEVERIKSLNIRTAIIRVGIILTREGGALKEMMKPIRLGLGAPLGNGEQYISWIHIDDICSIFKKAIEDKSMAGVYNGVAPNPISNQQMVKIIAHNLQKPLILPNVPAFALKILIGQMAEMVLISVRVSAKKIQAKGFTFKFEQCEEAIKNLLNENT